MTFHNAFALLIGIGRYANIRTLAKPENDANSVKDLLIDPAHCGYAPDNVKRLLNEEATKQGLLDGLKWLADCAQAGSTAIFFFAGHGAQNPVDGIEENYLLPYNCNPFDKNGTLDTTKLADTSISSSEFTAAIKNIDSQKLIAIFDCCHSGGIGDASRDLFQDPAEMRAGMSEDYYSILAQGRGRVIIASCLAGERSWERLDMHNGIFTANLLAALRGRASSGDGFIHLFELFADLSTHVPPDAATCYDKKIKGPAQQHPFLRTAIQDNFAISLDQGGARSIVPKRVAKTNSIIVGIRAAIIETPVTGVEMLLNYLEDKPAYRTHKEALSMRLVDLKEAARQHYDIGMIEPKLEAARRFAIKFALGLCWDIEDQLDT